MPGGEQARARIPVGGLAGVLAFAGLVHRFPEKLYHWDEFQLAYGVLEFDLARHQPHPPGYYGFILLGRALLPLVDDPALALRCVSAAAVAAFVVLALGPPRAGLRAPARGLLAAALLAFALLSPLLVRYGVAALSYATEGICWLALLLAWRHRLGGRALRGLAFATGLAGGIRPTLLIWSAALGALALLRRHARLGRRELTAVLAFGALGVLGWQLPLLLESGGPAAYREASAELVLGNVWAKSLFAQGLDGLWWERLEPMLAALAGGLGMLLPVALALAVLRALPRRSPELAALDGLLVGALLPFAFYALLIYDTSGYLVAALMPLAAWTFRAAGALLARRPAPQQLAAAGGLLLAATAFPLLPTPEQAAHERYDVHDALLESRFAAVRSAFDPGDTLLVTSNEYQDYGLRHVAHYLPAFTTLQLAIDPFFAITSDEQPYLVARGRELRAAGPRRLDLARLLDPPAALRHVVYMMPFDAPRFVRDSCAPLASPLPTDGGESLTLLTLRPGWRVEVRDQRLDCRRVSFETTSAADSARSGRGVRSAECAPR